jgi:hypothetical protein
MLARIPDPACFKVIRIALLVCAATALASCAKDPPPLIDSANTRETALPWNEQQKWEREGAAGQGLNTGRR